MMLSLVTHPAKLRAPPMATSALVDEDASQGLVDLEERKHTAESRPD